MSNNIDSFFFLPITQSTIVAHNCMFFFSAYSRPILHSPRWDENEKISGEVRRYCDHAYGTYTDTLINNDGSNNAIYSQSTIGCYAIYKRTYKTIIRAYSLNALKARNICHIGHFILSGKKFYQFIFVFKPILACIRTLQLARNVIKVLFYSQNCLQTF